MFTSSILPYIIWSDKCYLLVHLIVEIHLLGISMNCRWVHQQPPNPLLDLMMNSCFGTRFHSSFPENLWCHRRSVRSSWNLSTNVSWSSSTFWGLPGYQSNSWWEIPSLPSMNCIIIDHFIAYPPTQACSCLVLYLEFLAIQQLFFFTLEYYHPLWQECSEICSTSWEFLT